eukprot:COSAG02_NODE_16338_length_1091_cov_1.742944_1_plen_126_part_00
MRWLDAACAGFVCSVRVGCLVQQFSAKDLAEDAMVAVPPVLLALSIWIAVWRGAGAGSGNALANVPDARKYCIVGAGPGGLQLGQFMQHRGRDYATFERRDRAATFFDKYPVHRKLISINKRYYV